MVRVIRIQQSWVFLLVFWLFCSSVIQNYKNWQYE